MTDFLFPLLKNSKSGVDDRGHRLRICQAHRRGVGALAHNIIKFIKDLKFSKPQVQCKSD